MHWANVLADELLSDKKKRYVLATGITPSGPIHVGNMREILTTDAVYRCVKDKGVEADLIYIADDFDPLRKVYPYLPDWYEEYVGMPISEIPCPCGKHDSYADHYLFAFLSSLDEIGVEPRVYRANEMYKNGDYNESIEIALENTDKIRRIIEEIADRDLPKNWLPFNVRCSECGRIGYAKPLLYEYPIVEYKCGCGHEGEVDITKGGVGKLPWRVDWPARWKMLNVSFEPFGKDLGTTGGAWETGKKIVEEIYDYPAPHHSVYEFILLKGKGAMHSSKGTALSAEEMLKMTPPEVLRFLLMDNKPGKHITFDAGFGLLNLVDEYDQIERVYFGEEEKSRGMKDYRKTYELSQPYDMPDKMPVQISYRHIVTLVQIAEDWKHAKKILRRNDEIPEDLSGEEEKRLKRRVEHAEYWLDNFAPKQVKFKVHKKPPKVDLKEEQKKFLKILLKKLGEATWKPDEIHNMIYESAEETELKTGKAFGTIYQIILNQSKGPRAGYFLSNLDKDFVLKRVKKEI
ncbi:MAG: lysine--tRNA ligase [Candidatus Thermoplasmatota archaeon]